MLSQQTVTQLTSACSEHLQATHQLDLVNSAINRAKQQVALLNERYQLRQQQVEGFHRRIDQLAAKLQRFSPELNTQPGHTTNQKVETNQKSPDEVKQLRHQLQQRSELLRQSAHDLKTNFSIIRGATDMLVRAQTNADRQQMQGMLERNLSQASQLLTQLLDVTRLEAGQEHRQLTHFDVRHLLSELAESVQPLAHKKHLWVRQQGVGSLLIEGDRVKLYRIVQNLLLNAITYTDVGGVTLSWRSEAAIGEWSLTISDTGPGLSHESHQTSGEGIGLVIVRQLCSLLAGKLSIEEAVQGGTQFRVSFPLRYMS